MQIKRARHILVVCDDCETCAGLGELLGKEFVVEFERDGLVGLNRALEGAHELVIIGETLPSLAVLDFLRQLRRESRTPAVVLARAGGLADRIPALETGADEFLSASIDPRELLARLRGILRRSEPVGGGGCRPLQVGDLSLYPGARAAYLRDTPMRLTVMECRILEQLMRAVGRPVSRDQLCLLLYGRSALHSERFIDTHIRRIRHKMGEQRNMILSVRGTGYELRVPPERETAPETGS
jgi:DNA-binding response OmpR family regulator